MKGEVNMGPEKDKREISKINHEEFLRLWNEGVLGKEIARIMGVADTTVSMYAKTHRTECPKRTIRNQIDHAKFVEMWTSGKSINEISDELKISEAYVTHYAKENRESCPSRKPRIQIDHEEFLRLWELGISEKEIAEKLGVSEMKVSKYVKLHKDEFPRRLKKDQIDHVKLVKMWAKGQTIKAIAEAFNVSKAFVSIYLSEHRDECPRRKGNIHSSSKRKIPHEEFVKLWNSGYSLSEIAEKLGSTPKYVSKYAEKYRELCPCKKSSGSKCRVNHSKFVELWNSNCSLDEIAKYFETNKKAISHYASRHRDECPKRKRGIKK